MKLDVDIENEQNLQRLLLVILEEQADYWYDPCGKSGEDINRHLTDDAVKAIKRARFVWGLDGRGGLESEKA